MSQKFVKRRSVKVLPSGVANQIAAGEVVERPASVVKELIENSLDAEATHLEIEVAGGGASLIRISDDGYGIPRDELALALRSHTTSKLREIRDLDDILTLGFRGEALPSIASISRYTITSRSLEGQQGWCLFGEGTSSHGKPAPRPARIGTCIEVRDLFFNVPARRKFLRTEKTELHHIESIVRRMALSRFDVGFKFQHNNRQIWSLPKSADARGALNRIERLCGRVFAESAVVVDFSVAQMRIHGWLGLPGPIRKHPDIQFFFVNGRSVKDRTLSHAVRQAFANRLEDDELPRYILYFDLPSLDVDVNVHPAKAEVRFRETRFVHNFIFQHILKALSDMPGQRVLSLEASGYPENRSRLISSLRGGGLSAYRQLYGRSERSSRPLVGSHSHVTISERYAVCISGDQLEIVDLVAAQRLLQARRLQQVYSEGVVASRPLLVPVIKKMPEGQIRCWIGHKSLWDSLGLEFRQVGPDELAFTKVPVVMLAVDVPTLFDSIAYSLEKFDTDKGAQLLLEVLQAHENTTFVASSGAGLDEVLQSIADSPEIQSSTRVLLDQRKIMSFFSKRK